MPNGNADDHMDVKEIEEVMVRYRDDRAYVVATETARRLVYYSRWSDITEAARRVGGESYAIPRNVGEVLRLVPLDSDPFTRLGVEHFLESQESEGSSLRIKAQSVKKMRELLDEECVEAFITSHDIDDLHGSHPDADEQQERDLKRNMKTFVEGLKNALDNKAQLNVYITQVDDVTKANVANAWLIGLTPLHFPQAQYAELFKANLFISGSIRADFREKFSTDLRYYVENLVGREAGRKREERILTEMAEGAQIDYDRLKKLMEGNVTPKRTEAVSLQVYLSRFLDNVTLVPPVHRLNKRVMLFSREHSSVDRERRSFREGVPELRYNWAHLTVTNFPPLVDVVEEEYRKRKEMNLGPAWKSEWENRPSPDQDFLRHLNEIIAETAVGKIHSHAQPSET